MISSSFGHNWRHFSCVTTTEEAFSIYSSQYIHTSCIHRIFEQRQKKERSTKEKAYDKQMKSSSQKQVTFNKQVCCIEFRKSNDDGDDNNTTDNDNQQSSSMSTWISRMEYKRMAKREKRLMDGLMTGEIDFDEGFLITHGMESPDSRMQKRVRIREVLIAVLSEQQEQWMDDEDCDSVFGYDKDDGNNNNDDNHSRRSKHKKKKIIKNIDELARVSQATTRQSALLARERGIAFENFVLRQNGVGNVTTTNNTSEKGIIDSVAGSSILSGERKKNEDDGNITMLRDERMSTPISLLSSSQEGRWHNSSSNSAMKTSSSRRSVDSGNTDSAVVIPMDTSPAYMMITPRRYIHHQQQTPVAA